MKTTKFDFVCEIALSLRLCCCFPSHSHRRNKPLNGHKKNEAQKKNCTTFRYHIFAKQKKHRFLSRYARRSAASHFCIHADAQTPKTAVQTVTSETEQPFRRSEGLLSFDLYSSTIELFSSSINSSILSEIKSGSSRLSGSSFITNHTLRSLLLQ